VKDDRIYLRHILEAIHDVEQYASVAPAATAFDRITRKRLDDCLAGLAGQKTSRQSNQGHAGAGKQVHVPLVNVSFAHRLSILRRRRPGIDKIAQGWISSS